MAKKTRPPIVCVLGHVDHGKTSLLDVIRKTNVASKEEGGITQSIGASSVETKDGNKITFVDTPGHAAFSQMRSRGAKVADIAILVVSADDGVKPQTKEAREIITKEEIPFIVAITKTDLPSADIEGVKGQLEKEGILFEGRGGDTPFVAVSAKQTKGIDELLEVITLVAQVKGIEADKDSELEAVVIETTKNNKGPLASVIVRDGTLKVGEEIFAEGEKVKVRGLFNEASQSVKEVLPGEACQLMGFEKLPGVGTAIVSAQPQDAAVVELRQERVKPRKLSKEEKAVFVKTKNTGSMEALVASFPSRIVVVGSSMGNVNESDILEARSLGAVVVVFESNISLSVMKLAEAEGVEVKKFNIIYELLDYLGDLVKEGESEVLGKAEILASFPFNNKKVAGCKAVLGKITKGCNLTLLRDEKEIGQTKAVSLKRQKSEILEAKAGEEFGVIFEPQLDFKIGDVLVSSK